MQERECIDTLWIDVFDDELQLRGLTFDMSGDRRHAKHAGGRPLDGRVRR